MSRNPEADKAVAKLQKIGKMAMALKERGIDMTPTLARIEVATKAFLARVDKQVKDRNVN